MKRRAYASRAAACVVWCCIMAAGTSAQSFYPLQLGNRWTYRYSYRTDDTVSITVTADTLQADSRTYYTLTYDNGNLFGYVSADSETVRFQSLITYGDGWIFDLKAHVGDTLIMEPFQVSILTHMDTLLLFGQTTVVRRYLVTYGLASEYVRQFSDLFGLVRLEDYLGDPPPPWPSTSYELIGCQLGGVKYGYTVGVADPATVPGDLALLPNYPNPFNPATTIRFRLRTESQVTLTVVNLVGQQVRRLFSDCRPAGDHAVIFDARDDDRRQLPSGVYFVVLNDGTRSIARTVVLTK
jgi:hypothetical protein